MRIRSISAIATALVLAATIGVRPAEFPFGCLLVRIVNLLARACVAVGAGSRKGCEPAQPDEDSRQVTGRIGGWRHQLRPPLETPDALITATSLTDRLIAISVH